MPNPQVHVHPANSCCDCSLEHPCAVQPQGTLVTLQGGKTQPCAQETEAQRVLCRRQHPEGSTFFHHQSLLSQTGTIPGGRAADVLHLPSFRAEAGWILIICTPRQIFPWATSCHSTRSFCWQSATQKGVSGTQAAPRGGQGFPFNAVQTRESTTQGGRERTGIQPGSPCPCTSLREEHLSLLHSWPCCPPAPSTTT